jgi:hypothetical protein
MSLGLFTGVITFYVLYIVLPSTKEERKLTRLNWILLLQNLVYGSSLSGILYPGAGWMNPQSVEGKPQLYGFPVLVAFAWGGWWVERRRILSSIGGGGKKAQEGICGVRCSVQSVE